MTTSRHYNILVPRFDYTGPCNVAVDIAREAKKNGFKIRLLALNGELNRKDLDEFEEVRELRFSDLFTMTGILHTHCLRPDIVGGVFSIFGRCKVVTTLHNYFLIDLSYDHSRWKVRFAWFFWRMAVSKMDHIFCISNAMARYYKNKLPSIKLSTAYNFRSATKNISKQACGELERDVDVWLSNNKNQGRLSLAFVGSLNRRKNVLALVMALIEQPKTSLIICGDGPLEAELKQLILNNNLSERVWALGKISNPDSILSKVDVLVLPSFAEGMPLVVLEAARLGKPCLMSNIAVHRELAAIGLGKTFDHRTFSNFSDSLAALESLSSKPEIIYDIWVKNFSSEIGFSRYEKIIVKK